VSIYFTWPGTRQGGLGGAPARRVSSRTN